MNKLHRTSCSWILKEYAVSKINELPEASSDQVHVYLHCKANNTNTAMSSILNGNFRADCIKIKIVYIMHTLNLYNTYYVIALYKKLMNQQLIVLADITKITMVHQ